jgi:hypothetical protein
MTQRESGPQPRSKAFLAEIESKFVLDAAERPLLDEAGRVLDRIDQISADLRGTDLVDLGSKGQRRVNPLVVELRQQQLTLARLLGALVVPREEDDEAP